MEGEIKNNTATSFIVSNAEFRRPVTAYYFEPKEDITAYELAQCMMLFHGGAVYEDEWDSKGPWTRHWKRL